MILTFLIICTVAMGQRFDWPRWMEIVNVEVGPVETQLAENPTLTVIGLEATVTMRDSVYIEALTPDLPEQIASAKEAIARKVPATCRIEQEPRHSP